MGFRKGGEGCVICYFQIHILLHNFFCAVKKLGRYSHHILQKTDHAWTDGTRLPHGFENILGGGGGNSINSCRLTSIGNPIVEVRRSYDRLISIMGFHILVRQHLYIEPGPWLVRGMVHVWTYMQWCICGPPFQISQFNMIWCVNVKEIYFLCTDLLVWGIRVADLMTP